MGEPRVFIVPWSEQDVLKGANSRSSLAGHSPPPSSPSLPPDHHLLCILFRLRGPPWVCSSSSTQRSRMGSSARVGMTPARAMSSKSGPDFPGELVGGGKARKDRLSWAPPSPHWPGPGRARRPCSLPCACSFGGLFSVASAEMAPPLAQLTLAFCKQIFVPKDVTFSTF